MQKTITVDEKKVYKTALAALEDTYTLVYPAYDDDFPHNLLEQCLQKKSFCPATEENVYADAREYATRTIIENLLEQQGLDADQIQLFTYSEEYDQLRYEIQYRDRSNPERELLEKSHIHGFLQLTTNYDCWIKIYDQGGLQYEDNALRDVLAALSLNPRKVKEEARLWGIPCLGRWPDLKARNGKEIVDYEKFIACLNDTPNYGNWAFFGVFDGKALLDAAFNPESLIIPKGTTCCMFNNWDGGGSCQQCTTLRDLPVKDILRKIGKTEWDGVRVCVDEGNKNIFGYTPCSVYGGHLSNNEFLTN